MLSKSIKHFSLIWVGFWLFLHLFLQKQILLSLKSGHIKAYLVTESTYIIVHIKILWIIYLFAYRNMYFYYTFHCFIYRICIVSIQHIRGRYIKYAHSSCCSVHPLKRSILERHGIVYTC